MSNQNLLMPLHNPKLFIKTSIVKAVQNDTFKWVDQPYWPTRNIAFTPRDKSNRRKLIEALLAPSASNEQMSIGLQLLGCNREYRCGSPLCNYCRTQFQNRAEKRANAYFAATSQSNLYFLTVLSDLTYNPLLQARPQIDKLKASLRGCFRRHFQKQVRAFGALEVDVKRPDLAAANTEAIKLLNNYNFQQNAGHAFMPHLHTIIELDGVSADEFKKTTRAIFTKPKQVVLTPFRSSNTKQFNLRNTARYPIKFRYQYADNIMRSKPVRHQNIWDM